MEMKLELIPVPVSNIEVAKAFYIDVLGFHQDHDVHLQRACAWCN